MTQGYAFSGWELDGSHDWSTMTQNRHCSCFQILHFVHSLLILYKFSTCQIICPLLQTFLFELIDTCKLWLVRYISKHASQSLPGMTFCVYFKNKSKLLVATTLPHTKWLSYYSTKGASFDVKSSNKVTNLQATIPYLHRCPLILCTSTCT